MNKDVLVSIRGLQYDAYLGKADDPPIEMIIKGDYYKKNDSHYVLFEELSDDEGRTTRNMLKFKEHNLELTRKGVINVQMIFDEKSKTLSRYGTQFGEMLIGIDADSVTYTESEDEIHLAVDYALEVNYEFLADCKISVDIKSLTTENNGE